ncbi:hypothetical protein SNEBB_001151 [Seison nebaliae]|nr:hypothetical protein SNEBB_001151 [Seison nebaliae]
MGKKLSENTKAVAARLRKEEQKKNKRDKEEKEKEDALWVDDDKLVNRKLNRKMENEQKKREKLERKQTNVKLLEEEEESIKTTKKATEKSDLRPSQKVTRNEIEVRKKEEADRLEWENQKKETEIYEPITENLNHMEESHSSARNVNDAIDILSRENSTTVIESKPEKRAKAAFIAFRDRELKMLREEEPKLRLQQLRQMIRKKWEKSEENPFNQM